MPTGSVLRRLERHDVSLDVQLQGSHTNGVRVPGPEAASATADRDQDAPAHVPVLLAVQEATAASERNHEPLRPAKGGSGAAGEFAG